MNNLDSVAAFPVFATVPWSDCPYAIESAVAPTSSGDVFGHLYDDDLGNVAERLDAGAQAVVVDVRAICGQCGSVVKIG